MKTLYILALSCLFFVACHDVTVGYLKTENAVYVPDSLVIRKEPDPIEDNIRIQNQAPWMTLPIQGVIGTAQIHYEIENVSSDKSVNADIFKEELSIRGGGIMSYPLEGKAPAGRYVVSVRIWNEGYDVVKRNIFTFIVK